MNEAISRIDESLKKGGKISFSDVMTLIDRVEDLLLVEREHIVTVKPDSYERIIIVGDTHGDFESTKKIFEQYFDPKNDLLIFLGDYIDRGKYQVENILFIFLKKTQFPKNVLLLRGNHESILVNLRYGFFEAIQDRWPTVDFEAFVRFNEVFSLLPYISIIEDYGIFCVHGGIPSNICKVENMSFKFKDLIPSYKMAFELLWNDPRVSLSDDMPFFPSPRGEGIFLFGRKALEEFLELNNLNYVIRAHEPPAEKGFEFKFDFEVNTENRNLKGMEGRLLTVFTCRYYEISPTIAIVDTTEDSIKVVDLNAEDSS